MPQGSTKSADRRTIPSIDEILRTETASTIASDIGRVATLSIVRETVEEIRLVGATNDSRTDIMRLVDSRMREKHAASVRDRMRRVINATGVIVHTNLGRSALSENAIKTLVDTAGYCNVELDLENGERGRRGASAERLAAKITGADDAAIVNNCAAAALLTLSALAGGGEVIVSRGELVEIGGGFRIPEVLELSGCRLREVGTTNRTKLADYERAISADSKLILRVHPSNYRISGFTESPSLDALADLAHRHNLMLFEDAGSGALIDLSNYGLTGEPVISDSVASGADIVSFSGDKLLGAIQAGFIVGRTGPIDLIRKHPLYRAVRADKSTYSAIEATLNSFARDAAFDEIPTLRMLSMKAEDIGRRAEKLASQIEELGLKDISIDIVPGESAVGGGAGSGIKLETKLVALRHKKLSAGEIASAFRRRAVPIIGRISEDNFLLDLRTVFENDESRVVDAIREICAV